MAINSATTPHPWSEWNDEFRDTLRQFWCNTPGMLANLANKLLGSASLFDTDQRTPSASINFITAHDGFTLEDLVSYNEKHNHANLEDNRDGHSNNHSCNNGEEGPTDDSVIQDARLRHKRNILATLLLSQGVPMILAGDEVGNSQSGNNNAYCQDNSLAWIDWPNSPESNELSQFVKRLIDLRKQLPLLRQDRFLHGEVDNKNSGLANASWLNQSANPISEKQWADPENRFLCLLLTGANKDAVAIVVNNTNKEIHFPLNSEHLPSASWNLLLDTDHRAVFDSKRVADETTLAAQSVQVLTVH